MSIISEIFILGIFWSSVPVVGQFFVFAPDDFWSFFVLPLVFLRLLLVVIVLFSSFLISPMFQVFCLISCFLVSDAHNFEAESSAKTDYGFRAYGELARFVYCLLQKIKVPSSLPAVERWELYMLPNHSSFERIDYEQFLCGSTVLTFLEKVNSVYLRKEFKQNCLDFLEDLTSNVLSSLCARSPVGRGLSAFCPEILIGGDDHSALSLFSELINALGRMKWLKSSEKEGCKAEFQSFVRDQRDLEYGPSVRRPTVDNILDYCVGTG